MIILVTGGAGFIGSHLCDRLLEDYRNRIVCLDNFNDFYDPSIKRQNIQYALNNPNFTLLEGDILDKELVYNLFKRHRIDVVVHLAARAGVRPSIDEPYLYQRVNIEGTLNLLECARQFQIQRFLFASSSSVYGNNQKVPFSESDFVDYPVSPYAATKKAGELLAYNYHHLYQLPIACLRFFTVYGPRQRPEMAIHKFTRLILEAKKIPVFNNGECLRDYTYIDDIISGILSIMQAPHLGFDVVNIGESQTTSTLDLIKLIEAQLGITAKLDLMPKQSGDVDQTFADISHAKSTYAYAPKFPIEKGIKLFVDWYKKRETA
jgi:UDP-glucuronate 4-epimerase